VSINLRGREWTNPQDEVKVFNTLQCWKVVSDVPDQQEETIEVKYPVEVDYDKKTVTEKKAPKKAGNIEKKFEEEYINSLGGDLPF
jgi:hypothetical protein